MIADWTLTFADSSAHQLHQVREPSESALDSLAVTLALTLEAFDVGKLGRQLRAPARGPWGRSRPRRRRLLSECRPCTSLFEMPSSPRFPWCSQLVNLDRKARVGPRQFPIVPCAASFSGFPSLRILRGNQCKRLLHMFDLLASDVVGLDGGHHSGNLPSDLLHAGLGIARAFWPVGSGSSPPPPRRYPGQLQCEPSSPAGGGVRPQARASFLRLRPCGPPFGPQVPESPRSPTSRSRPTGAPGTGSRRPRRRGEPPRCS